MSDLHMSFALDVKVKNLFFDTAVVKRLLSDTERKGLSKIGAHLRTSMRSSLRRRKRVSQPGEPPSVHSSNPDATLKKIFFAYEPATHGVVVGPVRLNQYNRNSKVGGSITIPELMEKGGVLSIVEKSTNDGRTWRRANLRRNRRPGEKFRRRRALYRPRPFAGPTLAKEQNKGTIPSIFSARAA